MRQLERVRLAHLPTPLERMSRLTAVLNGPDLWVKRDDQTGLATGGNKTRKLELLMHEALHLGADIVLTVGAPQSNHCRQTAAAVARAGLDCLLILRGSAPRGGTRNGNLLLDDLLGAQVCWTGEEDPLAVLAGTAERLRHSGRKPYTIPYGGSNPLGAAAYALAFEELWRQAQAHEQFFDRIVFASSSGGTQAGLIVGARACGYTGRVVGISVDKTAGHLCETIAALLAPTAELLGLSLSFGPDDILVDDRYLGGGYAVLTPTEEEAVRLVARTEGVLLDPVYTGKAMAGLIDGIRRGEVTAGERVLFWHTGGTAALFAYAEQLLAATEIGAETAVD